MFGKYFPAPGFPRDYCSDPNFFAACVSDSTLIPDELKAKLDSTGRVPTPGDVKYIFTTKSGPGPISQPIDEILLDTATGLPKPPTSRHKRLKISAAGDEN